LPASASRKHQDPFVSRQPESMNDRCSHLPSCSHLSPKQNTKTKWLVRFVVFEATQVSQQEANEESIN
jgi:hypothetical protein